MSRPPQYLTAANGCVRRDSASTPIEKAGVEVVGASEVDANPRDAADRLRRVRPLPPSCALGAVDHARYKAAGAAADFALKFETSNRTRFDVWRERDMDRASAKATARRTASGATGYMSVFGA